MANERVMSDGLHLYVVVVMLYLFSGPLERERDSERETELIVCALVLGRAV